MDGLLCVLRCRHTDQERVLHASFVRRPARYSDYFRGRVHGFPTCHPAALQPGGLSSSLGDRALAAGMDFLSVCVRRVINALSFYLLALLLLPPSSAPRPVVMAFRCGRCTVSSSCPRGPTGGWGTTPAREPSPLRTEAVAIWTVCPTQQEENGER